jgi:hypothetical protein
MVNQLEILWRGKMGENSGVDISGVDISRELNHPLKTNFINGESVRDFMEGENGRELRS